MKPNETQAQRLAEVLKSMVPDITAEDKKALTAELGHTTGTIYEYLKGTVRNNDTAVKMIEFFRDRIAKREQIIID